MFFKKPEGLLSYWPMRDGQGEILVAKRRWIPRLVLRAAQPIVPTLRLVRDVTAQGAAV
jgi:hypothetical protein